MLGETQQQLFDEAEVVIVGGGIIGCAAAYELARAGKSVVLLERDEIGGQASGRNGGGVRQQRRDLAELPLAIASIRMWAHLAEELECDVEYRREGNLACALSEEEAEQLQRSVERQRAAGLEVHFLDRAGVRDVAPAVSAAVVAGSFCSTDGHANPAVTTIAYGRAASRAGARLYPSTPVASIVIRDGTVEGVSTRSGFVRSGIVVNAAGAWARQIGLMAGVGWPIIPRRSQVAVTSPMPPFLAQFVSGNTIYCRQARSGNIHIGGSGHWEPATFDQGNSFSALRRFATRASELVPALRGTTLLRAWGGTVELTPDEIPIIGWAEGVKGFLIAAGFSAHGFALGPITGKLVCDLVMGRRPSLSLDAFRPSRFPPGLDFAAAFKRAPEPPARGVATSARIA